MPVRDEVLKALETTRREKQIGKALEARVRIASSGALLDLLQLFETESKIVYKFDTLKELLNVSQVEIVPDASLSAEQVSITIFQAEGHKCDRCWNCYPDDSPQQVRQFGPWPNVCGRCADALTQMGYSEAAP
jgi:isoleucyl-tRNA synthetase